MYLKDVKIGDVVQAVSMHGIASPPMTVVAIFAHLKDIKDPKSRAGTVYLDFEGNEGDVWEEDIADLIPYVGDET